MDLTHIDARQKAILRFYNYFAVIFGAREVCHIDDIPADTLIRLNTLSLKELVRPFGSDSAVRGASLRQIERVYGVSFRNSQDITSKTSVHKTVTLP